MICGKPFQFIGDGVSHKWVCKHIGNAVSGIIIRTRKHGFCKIVRAHICPNITLHIAELLCQ